jgi:hypothetical protein
MVLDPSIGTFASGGVYATYAEVFFYIVTLPSGADHVIGGLSNQAIEIKVSADGTWKLTASGLGTVTGGLALPTGRWLRMILKRWSHAALFPSIFGTPEPDPSHPIGQRAKCEIVDVDSDPLVPVSYGTLTVSGANLGVTTPPTLQCGCVAPQTGTYDVWFDDAKVIAAYDIADVSGVAKWSAPLLVADGSLFTHSQVQGYFVTGQGVHDDFTPSGAYGNVDEIPKGVDSVSTSVSGNRTSYTKTPLTAGQEVEAMTLRANATGATATHALVLDSLDYDRTFSAATAGDDANTPWATEVFVSAIDKSTFDAHEIGVESKSASAFVLNNIFLEALIGTEALSANAGPDQVLDGVGFTTMAGSGTPGGLATFAWTQISGPTVAVFDDATDPTTDVIGLFTGTYVFRLTASYLGDDAFDEVSITVTNDEASFGNDDQTGETIGLSWVELLHKTAAGVAKTYLWSPVDLTDPAFYYGGFKEGRVLSFGEVIRGLSDARGHLESSTFSWIQADVDHLLRGLMDSVQAKYFKNKMALIRMISDASRRLFRRPRILARGVIKSYRPRGPLHFEFTAEDFLSSKFGAGNLNKQIPPRTISEINTAADVQIGTRKIPVIYGEISDENNVTTLIPGVATSPTLPHNDALPTVGGRAADLWSGGGALSGTLYYGVTVVRAGVEGVIGNFFATTAYNRSVWIPFSDSGTPGDTYRVYVWDGAGFDPRNMTGSTPAHCRFVEHNGVSNAGDTPPINGWVGDTHGIIFNDWTEGTDLLSTGTTDPHTETNDLGHGEIEGIYTGVTENVGGSDYKEFLIAGHAMVSQAITSWYVNGARIPVATADVAGDWLIPGYPAYVAAFGATTYTERNGVRFTRILVKGQAGDIGAGVDATTGSMPPVIDQQRIGITVNVSSGVESIGDGTGTPVVKLPQIYKHFVINFGFQSYLSGNWLTAPLWPVDVDGLQLSQIDEDSFDAIEAVQDRRITGGYPGGIVFGSNGDTELTLRDGLSRLNLSNDCRCGFNRNSQFFVTILDDSVTTITAARSYTQVLDIVERSFEIEPDADAVETTVVYSYSRHFAPLGDKVDPWAVKEAEVSDAIAEAALGEEKKGQTVELWGVRDEAVAQDIAMRRLMYYKEPPLKTKQTTNLKGLSTELGEVIKVTHLDGLGATGYVDRLLLVERHITNPSKYSVRFEAIDVQRLFGSPSGEGGGPFILGDEGTLAASWATATNANKVYGYLADETTGVFSNGKPGKRLR